MGGEARRDAERVMRRGPPCQICVARSFFGLLSRTEPELAGLLEYQGLLSDTINPPLGLYRLRPCNVGPEDPSDRSPTTGSVRVIDSRAPRGLGLRTPRAESTPKQPTSY